MSERVLLNSLLMMLFDRKIISEGDWNTIASVQDLVTVLHARGVLDKALVETNSKEVTQLLLRIRRLYLNHKLDRAVVEEMRRKHDSRLASFFDFVERMLLDKGQKSN